MVPCVQHAGHPCASFHTYWYTVVWSEACLPCLQRADQALGDFFQSIVNTMAGLFQVATGQKQAQVSIAPPSFFNNGAANVSTSVAGVAGAVSLSRSTRLT